MIDRELIKGTLEVLRAAENKPTAYDTTAEVRRVEGDTLWVHIPGGVDETPVSKTINAAPGDNVQVRVSGGKAFTVGNATAPPTDDTTANAAKTTADEARVISMSAAEYAEVARTAATEAQADAVVANTAANSALTQLSVVEDVAGVLNWISEHGTYAATTDTTVVPGKMYFVRTGSGTPQSPYVYNVVTNPASNPATAGYYELDSIDETVSNYISSHLALTNAGLWVIKDNNSYKVLLKSTGMEIYDATGASVASYGSTVRIGKEAGGRVEISSSEMEFKLGPANESTTPLSVKTVEIDDEAYAALELDNPHINILGKHFEEWDEEEDEPFDRLVLNSHGLNNNRHSMIELDVLGTGGWSAIQIDDSNGIALRTDGTVAVAADTTFSGNVTLLSESATLNFLRQIGLAISLETSDLDNLDGMIGTLELPFTVAKYTSAAAHTPTNAAGVVMTLRYSENYMAQFAFANNSSGDDSAAQMRLFARRYANNEWYSWYKVTLT